MRGHGVDSPVRYRWIQQPNQLYTIFNVPLFGVQEEIVDKKQLQSVLENLNSLKKKGFYSRVHIGHHVQTEDREGAGYIDNFWIKQETLYADIVEIPHKIFFEIKKNKKYPYLSVEYLPSEGRITTVALLESQPPFFKFPLLVLQDKPDKAELYEQFSAVWELRKKLITFQEKGLKMEEEVVENPEKKDEQKKDSVDLQGLFEAVTRIEALLQEHDQRLQSLVEMERHKKGEAYSEKEEKEEKEERGKEGEKPSADMASPSSVAYSEVLKRLNRLELTANKEIMENKLKNICDQRGLNFAEQKAVLCKFSSQKDAEIYLDAISARPIKHSVSNLQKFSSTKNSSLLEQKYEEIVGSETNEDNLRKFQAIWGKTPAKFVEFYSQYPEKLEDLTK